MGELSTGQIIKWILGALVIVLAIVSIGYFFGGKVVSFFANLPGGNASIRVLMGLRI